MRDLAAAAEEAHSTSSAGYLADVDSLEIPIRQSGRVRSVEDIERTVTILERLGRRFGVLHGDRDAVRAVGREFASKTQRGAA